MDTIDICPGGVKRGLARRLIRGGRTAARFAPVMAGLAALLLHFAVTAAGDLDTTFGVGGTVTTNFSPSNGRARALVVQTDGKLVAAGGCGLPSSFPDPSNFDFCLARYNANGSLDTSGFGVGGTGIMTTDISGGDDTVNALVLQTDGMLVAAGSCGFPDVDFCLARYQDDGTLDPNFGGGGSVTTDFSGGDTARALILQPDGKLVAAGVCTMGSYSLFCLARYNSNGSLDTAFGGGGTGIVTTNISGGDDAANALILQPDGKLVAAGVCGNTVTSFSEFCLARYNSNGTLDTSGFGVGGTVTTDINAGPDRSDRAFALVLQPDGKLVAAGACDLASFTIETCLARYNSNGTLDTTGFGVGGTMTIDVSGISDHDAANALVLQPNGKLVTAGFCDNSSGGIGFCLARYNSNGSLDTTFGAGTGTVTTDINVGFDEEAVALVLQPDQPDGKLVAAGGCDLLLTNGFCLASYRSGTSGTADPEESVLVSTAPTAAGEAGVTATLSNNTNGTGAATVTVQNFGNFNPGNPNIIDVGGQFVDLHVEGADLSDEVAANFYYSSSVTDAMAEANLQLLYFNSTTPSWDPVVSNGPTLPLKDTTDDLDGTVSGGRFTVTFGDTSTPSVTELTGTVFTGALTPVGGVAVLIDMVAGLDLNRGLRQGLSAELKAAERLLHRGHPAVAKLLLKVFIRQVQVLKLTNRLLSEAADELIRFAEAVIGAL